MQFEIKSRFSNAVLFTAELDVKFSSEPQSIQLGAAVRKAVEAKADLSGANLRGAYLYRANLRDTDLRDTDLCGANLNDADLYRANLRGANLYRADLSGANLRGAYLCDAYLCDAYLSGAKLRGVPEIKNIHQAVYEAASKPGCFNMSYWHCGTAHCRAGWIVTLAGAGGSAMEFCMGTPAAAALIYLKSDPNIGKIPDFYANNETALADMKRLADLEREAA